MRLLLATFWLGVLSAVFPLINMEAYIAGIAATIGHLNVWLVASIAGVGQAIGKIPWYEVSRSSMHWSYIQKKMQNPDWRRRYDAVHDQVERRPWMGATLLFSSALVALPPLAVTAVLAGQLAFNRALFYTTIVVGRTLQFAAILGGIAWLVDR